MPHFRKMFDERFIGSWDLEGRDEAIVVIRDIKIEELKTTDGTVANKPVLLFTKGKKGMVLNKTNAKQIAELYGSNTEKWKGKAISLFATTCDAFGKKVECVRVNNRKPAVPSTPVPDPEPPDSPPVGNDDDLEGIM